MNKNNVIRIISVILALSMMLTVYGCKSKSSSTTNGEMSQPAIDNSTAVVKYTSVDSNGKKVDETKIMTNVNQSSINVGTTGAKLSETLKDDDAKKSYTEKLEKSFGVSEEKAQQIVNDTENWAEFTYVVYVANTNSQKIAFRYINATGDDNIVINNNLDCEYGLPAGVASSIAFSGVVNLTKYPDTEALQKALSAMKISVNYTVLNDGVEDVDDWSAVTTQTMPVSVAA
jgi:thiamine pyrophosphate-dependent acetolactate synthase large subunit-like protein